MVKSRTCCRCGKKYLPASSTQKYCLECRVIVEYGQRLAYRRDHPEKVVVWHANYKTVHLIEEKSQVRQWRKTHPENIKMWAGKSRSKRRALGFVLLNQPFVGGEGHHIDKEHVVYIPKELHQGVQHNLWTGQGMEEINRKAYEWMGEAPSLFPLDIFLPDDIIKSAQ